MTDYTDLVEDLLHCATSSKACASCNRKNERYCQDQLHAEAADAIEKMNVPIAVRCYEDCYWVCYDEGDFYTPPSVECGKDDGRIFDLLNLDPCYGEDDKVDVPDCPFYLNRSKLEEMVGRYHYYEWDWGDGV